MTGASRFVDPHRAFVSWGVIGAVAAVLLGTALTRSTHLSLATAGALALVAVATFGALVLANLRPGSGTRLVYYHHEVAIFAACSAMLVATRRPLLPYLDLTALCVGTFLLFGRVGCRMAGCCHGRPAHWGLKYDQRYVATGFPEHLIGVRLLPVQTIEAGGVLVVVAYGCLLARTGAPGAALAWYIAGYGALRYTLEFLRGDAGRRIRFGNTQAQWFSVGLGGAVVAAGALDALPSHHLHTAFLAVMVVAVAVRAGLRRRSHGAGVLRDPVHVSELAATLEALRDPTVPVRATFLGMKVSASVTAGYDRFVHQYTLSATVGTLARHQAAAIAALIGQLHGTQSTLLTGRGTGVFHVLLGQDGSSSDPVLMKVSGDAAVRVGCVGVARRALRWPAALGVNRSTFTNWCMSRMSWRRTRKRSC